MPRNGSGVYTPPANNVNPAVPDTEIDAISFNAMLTDLSEAMTDSIASDGQTTIVDDIPFNNNKLTEVGLATTLGDALSYGRDATVADLIADTVNGMVLEGDPGAVVEFGGGGTVIYDSGTYPNSSAPKTGDYTVQASDTLVKVNAAGGAITLTVPVALGTVSTNKGVTIVKTDATTNPVLITTDGSTIADALVNPKNLNHCDFRQVILDGTDLYSVGGG